MINKQLHPNNVCYTRQTNGGIYRKKSMFFQLKATFLPMNLFAWRNLIKRKQHCDIFQAKECDLHIWQTEIKNIYIKKEIETNKLMDSAVNNNRMEKSVGGFMRRITWKSLLGSQYHSFEFRILNLYLSRFCWQHDGARKIKLSQKWLTVLIYLL